MSAALAPLAIPASAAPLPAGNVAAAALPADIDLTLFADGQLMFQQLMNESAMEAPTMPFPALPESCCPPAATATATATATPTATVLPTALVPDVSADIPPSGDSPLASRPQLAKRREMRAPMDDAATLQLLAQIVPSTAPAAAAATAASNVEPAIESNQEGVAADLAGTREGARVPAELAARVMDQTLQRAEAHMTPPPPLAISERFRDESRTTLPLGMRHAPDGEAQAAALSATQSLARHMASANQPVERSVTVPVHDPRFAQAVAAEVRWCAENAVQSATLRLSPEHLGPLEVRIDLRDSQVNVSFGASQAETRAALEQAMPRLRELLAGAGLSLGEAHVQQEMRRESHSSQAAFRGNGREDEPLAHSARVVALGLVDEYA